MEDIPLLKGLKVAFGAKMVVELLVMKDLLCIARACTGSDTGMNRYECVKIKFHNDLDKLSSSSSFPCPDLIFPPKKFVTGKWQKANNKQLRIIHFSQV